MSKKISVSLSRLEASIDALSVLMDVRLPATKGLALKYLAEEINAKLGPYRDQVRDIYLKHGEKVGDDIRVLSENVEDFEKDMAELREVSVDVTVPDLTVDDLEARGWEPTVNELDALSWLVPLPPPLLDPLPPFDLDESGPMFGPGISDTTPPLKPVPGDQPHDDPDV